MRSQPHHDHCHGPAPDHNDGLAEILDLDAEVFGSSLEEVTEWVARHTAVAPHRVVDVGAGPGAGSLALARRFTTAEVIAIDRSQSMLDRVEVAAGEHRLADRLRVVQADLDQAWPAVGPVDLAWAASSLHEITDPDRLLRDVHAALTPGGLLAVVEMDALPRFLPDDIGVGRPGLESRAHDALARAGWNAHPDWRPHLEKAGFEVAGQRTFIVAPSPAPPSTGRFAQAYLSHVRPALDGRLGTDDLDVLDLLLTEADPDGLLRRGDLAARGSRTVWVGRR